MKKKGGVREEVKESKNDISDHQHKMKKEWALPDAILENENIILTAAVILSFISNGKSPALVMSLSSFR